MPDSPAINNESQLATVAEHLDGLWIILLETGGNLVTQARLVINQLPQVTAQALQQPVLLWPRRQRFEAMSVGPQQMGHRQGIESVVFGGRQDMPIFVAIDRLGIDGIDLVALAQEIID